VNGHEGRLSCRRGKWLIKAMRFIFITNYLSLFATAQKVTKNAAAADKRLKINSCAIQENKLGRRNRPQTYFLILIYLAGRPAMN